MLPLCRKPGARREEFCSLPRTMLWQARAEEVVKLALRRCGS